MPETGLFLKEPLFALAWERAQRGGVPLQALGVQGDLMVIRRGTSSPPWYGEYQWLASSPGRRDDLFKTLQSSGKAAEENRTERFDLQYRGSPEFPSTHGLLVSSSGKGILLEGRCAEARFETLIRSLPRKTETYSEASSILDTFQREFEALQAKG